MYLMKQISISTKKNILNSPQKELHFLNMEVVKVILCDSASVVHAAVATAVLNGKLL